MYCVPCEKVTSLFIIIFGDRPRSCMRMQPLNLLDDVWNGPALMWLPEALQDNTTFSCGLCSLQKVWEVLTSFLEPLEARQACDVLLHGLQTLWKFCEKVLVSCGLWSLRKKCIRTGYTYLLFLEAVRLCRNILWSFPAACYLELPGIGIFFWETKTNLKKYLELCRFIY